MPDTACICIQPVPLTDHGGHCCLRDWDETGEFPGCHADEWEALRERLARERES